MSDDLAYNTVSVMRLVADALKPLLGHTVDRISFNVNIDDTREEEIDCFYIVVGGKKWSIQIDDYKEKQDEI